MRSTVKLAIDSLDGDNTPAVGKSLLTKSGSQVNTVQTNNLALGADSDSCIKFSGAEILSTIPLYFSKNVCQHVKKASRDTAVGELITVLPDLSLSIAYQKTVSSDGSLKSVYYREKRPLSYYGDEFHEIIPRRVNGNSTDIQGSPSIIVEDDTSLVWQWYRLPGAVYSFQVNNQNYLLQICFTCQYQYNPTEDPNALFPAFTCLGYNIVGVGEVLSFPGKKYNTLIAGDTVDEEITLSGDLVTLTCSQHSDSNNKKSFSKTWAGLIS